MSAERTTRAEALLKEARALRAEVGAGLHDQVRRHGLTIVKSRRFYFGVMELLVLTK